jgi:hypothetical protein|tara:strand:- start:184 stop:459 length:276 start_codon:yes stop_codon:yes gene_type:complete
MAAVNQVVLVLAVIIGHLSKVLTIVLDNLREVVLQVKEILEVEVVVQILLLAEVAVEKARQVNRVVIKHIHLDMMEMVTQAVLVGMARLGH